MAKKKLRQEAVVGCIEGYYSIHIHSILNQN